MKIKIQKQLGNSTIEIEVEGRDEKDALSKTSFFIQKDTCGNCNSENVSWFSSKIKSKKDGKEYIYIKRKCLDCGFENTAGEYNSGGLFWNNEWVKPFSRKQISDNKSNEIFEESSSPLTEKEKKLAEEIPF